MQIMPCLSVRGKLHFTLMDIILKNALIVTQNEQRDIFPGDIWIAGNRIKALGPRIEQPGVETLDLSGYTVIPGLIQTHVHLCQALFRNLADDLELLDWLTRYIWPMEMHHSRKSLQASARLGLYEMLTSGVTTILDMGCAGHMDAVFDELDKSGIRAFCGKVMMDHGEQAYKETTGDCLASTENLIRQWHLAADGRIQYALAPRFVLSCSMPLWEGVRGLADDYDLLIHTHAAENRTELALVEAQTGYANVEFFVHHRLASGRLCLAHCIWLSPQEHEFLAEYDIKVLHCPAANLKLGSGFAAVPDMLRRGVNVSLGSDGAPCNNNLDIFTDMRLAALIHKPNFGVTSITAGDVFDMATLNGAKALGLGDQTGSIEAGKLADLAILDLHKVHAAPVDNVISQIVYSAQSRDVQQVMVNGEWVVKDRVPLAYPDEREIVSKAQEACAALLEQLS